MPLKPSFQRIAGLNLAIVLTTAVVLRLANQGPGAEFGFRFEMTGAILLHSLLLMVLALTGHPPETRGNYWLGLLLVWLVGFGACAAGAAV